MSTSSSSRAMMSWLYRKERWRVCYIDDSASWKGGWVAPLNDLPRVQSPGPILFTFARLAASLNLMLPFVKQTATTPIYKYMCVCVCICCVLPIECQARMDGIPSQKTFVKKLFTDCRIALARCGKVNNNGKTSNSAGSISSLSIQIDRHA